MQSSGLLVSVSKCVSCWAGMLWRGKDTCRYRVLLYSGAYFALSSWIADEEGAHAGSYVLCFNAWVLASAVRVVCSLSASMPFPWGTAHKISFIPSLPTQHTASAEMQVQVCECKR